MDCFKDPSTKLKYQKCKMKVKRWESEFRKENGTNPSKDDIKEAPSQIREAYKWYWRLKIHALGQDSLLDGTFEDQLTKSNTDFNASRSSFDISVSSDLCSTIVTSDHNDSPNSSVSDQIRDKLCLQSSDLFSVQNGEQNPSDVPSDFLNDKPHDQLDSLPIECDVEKNTRKVLGGIQNLNEVFEMPHTNSKDIISDRKNMDGHNIAQIKVNSETLPEKLDATGPEREEEVKDQEISNPNSVKVWGSHLNNSKVRESKVGKTGLTRSSSFQLAEKLFVGSKFKKRNPRKSISFSHNRNKDKDGFATPENDSLAVLSQPVSSFPSSNSQSFSDSQNTDDGFPISSFIAENELSSALKDSDVTEEKVKVVKKSTQLFTQPISAVHKLLDEGGPWLKSKVERKVDMGWLERVSQANSLADPLPVSCDTDVRGNNVKKGQTYHNTEDLGVTALQTGTIDRVLSDDSDDDLVYDSDTESNVDLGKINDLSSKSAILPSVDTTRHGILPAVGIVNCQSESQSTTPQENPKKRKLDAIEVAMAVLSERRKADRDTPQPSKKPRKSVTSKKKQDAEEDSEDVDDPDMADDKSSSKKSTGTKMTKKEFLEKRVSTGSVNDNFVRINLKKKVFVRGKKTMTFQKYKKQQWKNRKKELASDADAAYISRMDPSDGAAGGGLQKCFKCGEVGHYARACLKMRGDTLMPIEDEEEEESPFPTLAEVEAMAKEKGGLVHARLRAREAYEEENRKATTVTMAPLHRAVPLVMKDPGTQEETSEDSKAVSEMECLYKSEYNFEDDDMMDMLKEPEYVKEINFGSVQPLYPLKRDGTVIATPPEVYECLQLFGHEKFRPGQEEAVMRILSGLSTLVTLSTGSGKSLCYQLPAYLYACRSNCITLVVSPLVSLMDDQVTGLPRFIKAAALHTNQTAKQREKVMEMIKSGKLQFLLVSPEAVVAGEKRTGFGSILQELPDIAFACIDEAHCVSQWSHNFRPSYLMICKVLREKLGIRTVLGLTATATRATVGSIIEHLSIPDGRRGVIQDVPLPDNLLLTVSRDSQRDRALIQLLNTPSFQKYESIIIYCTRREECERLAGIIRTCMRDPKRPEDTSKRRKVSTNAEAYHAGLSASRRKQVQAGFMSGSIRTVVATVAFGMGINKANIRAVIHFNMPRSFESYVQEVGRAGRDGLPSHCHCFLNSEGGDLNELRRHIYGDSMDRHTIRKLLQRVFVPCKCKEKETGDCKDNQSQETPASNSADGLTLSSVEDGEKVKPDDMVHNSECMVASDCQGHEVAFSIEETVAALDLPEENITTLLCYLELHHKQLIKVLPHAYTVCKVQSYRGMKHIKRAARTCPPLAMAIAMDILQGIKHDSSHALEFPVVEIAAAIGWDSGIVKRELMNLEWTKVNDKPRRSGIKVEFSNLGFRVRAPGNLPAEELDSTLDFLFKRVDDQERSALSQLHAIFTALSNVSSADIRSLDGSKEIEERSEVLKGVVRAYFQHEDFIFGDYKPEEKLENGEQIASDTRQLVSMYRDCSFTGRAVARIFHGINSPNFPAHVWARCRFWRAHLESDFKLICLLATRVLLKLK